MKEKKSITMRMKEVVDKFARLSPLNYLKIRKYNKMSRMKLNIGCGDVKFPGWVNIDRSFTADLVVDLRKGLPFADNSAVFIYNEHFIEHVEVEEAQEIVKDFYRVLDNGGILRIATPDLDYLLEKYFEDWKSQDWLSMPEFQFIRSKGQMINVSFRWWGHKYLFNEDDLRTIISNAGFKNIVRFEKDKSNYPELTCLESRSDSKLILEAEK